MHAAGDLLLLETQAVAPAFPVVGIGASAGGLEAMQLFFQGVPTKCGMAFVVVQHMDPTHDGILVEILQRSTVMPVKQITDHMRIKPDTIYVIPPDNDLSILGDQLLLFEPVAHRGLRLPIDFFFRTLAAELRERSIGLILSGMGSDGTLGIRAIKEVSGSVFVQDPKSAKFDSMPCSAIGTGLADVVAVPELLAAKVMAYRNSEPWRIASEKDCLLGDESLNLDKLIALLRVQTGHDFSQYKKSTIYRRVERRMALHQLYRIVDYLRYLRQNQQESSLLFKELLIGVTRFFRDPEVWETLKTETLPNLFKANPSGGTLRAWIPACSTGEEAYTLAMIFREALDQLAPGVHYGLKVFATDLDADAIQTARAGIYPINISSDVSQARLTRFFVQEDNTYRVCRELRAMVIFSQQNLVMDPPFTKIDLLSCRNLLIYLESDLQRKLLPLFHYSLRSNGVLVLGSSETLGDAATLFSTLSAKMRIFQRRDLELGESMVEFPSVFSRSRAGVPATLPHTASAVQKVPDLYLLTNELLLQRFAPAAVLTSNTGNIVYICGKTGKYLEPATGIANMSLFAMAREGLSEALSEVFSKAVREQTNMTIRAVQVGSDADAVLLDVTVQPLSKPLALSGMVLVVFTELTTPPPGSTTTVSRDWPIDDRIASMALEMQNMRDALKATRDEMQNSQEELKATNEELQSTNEELQSTNEELTTSKEEMQSMNEELQSVNVELTYKVEEMSQASDDMKNLLNSTAIATLFLDDQMHVRRYTTPATAIFKLIPGDLGRPITDLVTSLDYSTLASDAQEVLRTLVFREVQVSSENNRWFNVRTMPYRTQDNRIDGVVITFVDITSEMELENTLDAALKILQETTESPELLLARVKKLLVTNLNPQGRIRTIAHLSESGRVT